MRKPEVSVLMPVFNQALFLKEAIKSILSQSFRNFEFLILDDASTDKSLKLIKSFKDKRIKIFSHKKRKGLAKSLNFLIKKAQGEYVARMDGDDISEKQRLQKQAAFLNKNKKVVLIGSWAKIIDKQNKVLGKIKYPVGPEQIRREILKYNPFVHPSVMIRKEILVKEGGYNQDLFYSQDYDLFLRLVSKYQCANLPEYLLKIRWQPDFKKQKAQHRLALKTRLKAIKDYGYHRIEILKLFKPFLLYLIPSFVKKIYWRGKLRSWIVERNPILDRHDNEN